MRVVVRTTEFVSCLHVQRLRHQSQQWLSCQGRARLNVPYMLCWCVLIFALVVICVLPPKIVLINLDGDVLIMTASFLCVKIISLKVKKKKLSSIMVCVELCSPLTNRSFATSHALTKVLQMSTLCLPFPYQMSITPQWIQMQLCPQLQLKCQITLVICPSYRCKLF